MISTLNSWNFEFIFTQFELSASLDGNWETFLKKLCHRKLYYTVSSFQNFVGLTSTSGCLLLSFATFHISLWKMYQSARLMPLPSPTWKWSLEITSLTWLWLVSPCRKVALHAYCQSALKNSFSNHSNLSDKLRLLF